MWARGENWGGYGLDGTAIVKAHMWDTERVRTPGRIHHRGTEYTEGTEEWVRNRLGFEADGLQARVLATRSKRVLLKLVSSGESVGEASVERRANCVT